MRNIQVIQEPYFSPPPIGSKIIQCFFLARVAGLILGLFVAVFVESRHVFSAV